MTSSSSKNWKNFFTRRLSAAKRWGRKYSWSPWSPIPTFLAGRYKSWWASTCLMTSATTNSWTLARPVSTKRTGIPKGVALFFWVEKRSLEEKSFNAILSGEGKKSFQRKCFLYKNVFFFRCFYGRYRRVKKEQQNETSGDRQTGYDESINEPINRSSLP